MPTKGYFALEYLLSMEDQQDINPNDIELPDPNQGLAALRNSNRALTNADIESLSSIWGETLAAFKQLWPKVASDRKVKTLEQMATLSKDNLHLSYEEIALVSLKTEEGIGRKWAIDILENSEDVRAIPSLVNTLNTDTHPQTRGAAAEKLFTFLELAEDGLITDRNLDLIEASLIDAANSDDSVEVRAAAVASLGPINTSEVENVIRDSALNQNISLQAAAVLAMGRSYDVERWQDYVQDSFEHISSLVRQNAALAAGMFAEEALAGDLAELLFDEEDEVLASTIWALGEIGGRVARRKLMEFQAIHEGDETFEDAIEDALAMMDLGEGSGDIFSI